MATFATNNADIARYARRPNDALWTQLIGMPLAFGVVAFFGIFVTSASKPLFGKVSPFYSRAFCRATVWGIFQVELLTKYS